MKVAMCFLKKRGVNFKSYLDNIRIQKATDLLLTTDMPITEISTNVGYENIRTFNNVFKKLLGKTPTDYKKEKIKTYSSYKSFC